MTPYFRDEWLTVYGGDCRAVLREMEPESVHCVVTSPPYWGLRDYGTPGQLGLEATPEAYVAALVDVFREVRRVLRADGTVWLNLGDSYAGSPVGTFNGGGFKDGSAQSGGRDMSGVATSGTLDKLKGSGLKPKDLVGIPWRVAFALQADGWYLRSDIIWSKPNPMPESVTDRPTKSHEYLFLLSKSARYYFDADAVREPVLTAERARERFNGDSVVDSKMRGYGSHAGTDPAGRNIRSVWTIATAPYPGSHFATFPPKLVEPCVKAGTSERGVCPECGAPWVRVVERGDPSKSGGGNTVGHADGPMDRNGHGQWDSGAIVTVRATETTGWRPSCGGHPHRDMNGETFQGHAEPVPATVLDPFAGTGTVGLVAAHLSRRAVLIDLNPDYLRQCLERNRQTPLGLPA